MLARFFKRINALSKPASLDLVGLDLNSNILKVARVSVLPNKMEVVGLHKHDIGGLSEGEVAKAVFNAVNVLNLKGKSIINIIPSHLIITKNIEIPSIDPKEIKEIISLQAGRHTPYSRDEVTVDYINIGASKANYSKILLVIVARSVVERQYDILSRAGLKLDKVYLAPEALAHSLLRVFKIESHDSPVAMVHVDEAISDFIVVSKNKAVYIRSIPVGAQQFSSDKEHAYLKFSEEVKKSQEAYLSEEVEKGPNALLLTGAVEGIRDLGNILSDSLHLPVKVMSYLNSISFSQEALKVASGSKTLSFLGLISSLMVAGEMKVDLIPEKVKLRKAIEERGRDLIRAGILMLSIFIVISSIMVTKIYFKTVYLRKLNATYVPLRKEAGELENDFTKIAVVRGYLANRGFALEVLTEIFNTIPLEVEVNYLKFDGQGKLTIRGTAASMSVIFAFVDNLEKSSYFKDVKTKYTTMRKEGIKDLADFEIGCTLESSES